MQKFCGGTLWAMLLKNVWIQAWGTVAVGMGFLEMGISCVPRNLWNMHARQITSALLILAGICTFLLLRRADFSN